MKSRNDSTNHEEETNLKNKGHRHLRLTETVRRSLGEIFLRHDFNSQLISTLSVQSVDMSKDMRYANVFVYPLITTPVANSQAAQKPQDKSQKQPKEDKSQQRHHEQVLSELHLHAADIGKLLGKYLTSKYTPKLRFFIDPSVEQAERIEKLLHK